MGGGGPAENLTGFSLRKGKGGPLSPAAAVRVRLCSRLALRTACNRKLRRRRDRQRIQSECFGEAVKRRPSRPW